MEANAIGGAYHDERRRAGFVAPPAMRGERRRTPRMNDAPRFALADLLCMLLILGGAAGARAWYVATCLGNGQLTPAFVVQGQGPARALPGDTGPARTEIEELAHHIREERWFGCLAPLCDHRE